MEDKEKPKLLEPMPITRQMVFNWSAQAAIGQHPDDLYYICTSIKTMLSDSNIGDKPLRDHYGDKLPKAMSVLDKGFGLAMHTKSYFDTLKGKSVVEPDVDSKHYRLFVKYNDMLVPYYKPILKMYCLLIEASLFSKWSIPSEAFSFARKQYKSFEIEEQEIRQVEKQIKEDLEDED